MILFSLLDKSCTQCSIPQKNFQFLLILKVKLYSFWHFIKHIGGNKLKKKLLARTCAKQGLNSISGIVCRVMYIYFKIIITFLTRLNMFSLDKIQAKTTKILSMKHAYATSSPSSNKIANRKEKRESKKM